MYIHINMASNMVFSCELGLKDFGGTTDSVVS